MLTFKGLLSSKSLMFCRLLMTSAKVVPRLHLNNILPARRLLSRVADDRFNSFKNDSGYEIMLSASLPISERIANLKHILSNSQYIFEDIQFQTDKILKYLIYKNETEELVSVVKLMLQHNIPIAPSIVTQTISLTNFAKKYDVSALLVDYAMKSFTTPDAYIWNIKLNDLLHAPVYTNKDKVATVMEVYQHVTQMHAHKLQLTPKLYSQLLKSLCDIHRPLEAFNLLLYLSNNGLPFSQHMFGSIIRLACSAGRLSDAFLCLDRCVASNLSPDRGALVTLLKCVSSEPPLLPLNKVHVFQQDSVFSGSGSGSSSSIVDNDDALLSKKLDQVMQSAGFSEREEKPVGQKLEEGKGSSEYSRILSTREAAGRRVYQLIDLLHQHDLYSCDDPTLFMNIFNIYVKNGDIVNAEFLFWEITHRQIDLAPQLLYQGLLTAYCNHMLLIHLRDNTQQQQLRSDHASASSSGDLSAEELAAWRETLLDCSHFNCPTSAVEELRAAREGLEAKQNRQNRLRAEAAAAVASRKNRQYPKVARPPAKGERMRSSSSSSSRDVAEWQERFPQLEEVVSSGEMSSPSYRVHDLALTVEQCCDRMVMIYNELALELKLRPDAQVLRQCLLGAVLSQMADRAMAVLEMEYSKAGVKRSEQDFALVIAMLLKMGDRASALSLYEIAKREVKMSRLSYSEYDLFEDSLYWPASGSNPAAIATIKTLGGEGDSTSSTTHVPTVAAAALLGRRTTVVRSSLPSSRRIRPFLNKESGPIAGMTHLGLR